MTVNVAKLEGGTDPAATAPRRVRLKIKLAVAFVGILAGLLLAEVAVRFCVPVRNVGPSFSAFDPAYGKRLKVNYSCERVTPEFRMTLTTNEFGFRGPPISDPDVRPILFIGDSFTMGFGVGDGEEFPAVFRREWRRVARAADVPVLNAGLGDVGNGRWIRFLTREAPQFHPRAVVLQLCGNDFTDNLREPFVRLDDAGNLELREPTFKPGFARLAQSVIESLPGLAYSHLISFMRETRFRGRNADTPTPPPAENDEPAPAPGDALTFGIVEEIVRICRSNDWRILVLVADFDGPRLEELSRRLNTAAVPVVAVPTKLARPDLYYAIDGHWNVTGHQHVARLLLDIMNTLGWLDSP
jgi:lysophospholipase L1-like esterase